ncbi:MAG TPA: trehalose-6-phosphate synthase, partial [Chroococcales cyanobacterium]
MKSGVVIASNRLPVSVKRTKAGDLEFIRSIGGLTSSLSAYRKNEKKIWIGWPGIARDDLSAAEKRQITQELARHHCVPVFLTQQEINDYYNGFSNSVLWLLFHNQPSVLGAAAQPAAWQTYRLVNERFAATILKHAGADDVLWVHDYHLMLVPALLRAQRSHAQIGFFLHIPFPPASRLACLPHAKELLRGT